jgi:geranylgeranyl transferase type-1 subunit beta
MPRLIHWLSSRQFVYLEPEPPTTDTGYDGREEDEEVNFLIPKRLSDLSLSENLRYVACNGRCNKVADTCYTWWVAAALVNLGKGDLLDWQPSRRFLLEKMAHRIGGFGKHPGGPPDVYHSCFGLTALAVMGEPGLNELDGALAVPARTVTVIEKARANLLRGESGKDSYSAAEGVELALKMRGERPTWLGAVGGG